MNKNYWIQWQLKKLKIQIVMIKYLNDFHKKNSEEAMRILSKQKPLSPEEAEAQTQAIHQSIEKEQSNKSNK